MVLEIELRTAPLFHHKICFNLHKSTQTLVCLQQHKSIHRVRCSQHFPLLFLLYQSFHPTKTSIHIGCYLEYQHHNTKKLIRHNGHIVCRISLSASIAYLSQHPHSIHLDTLNLPHNLIPHSKTDLLSLLSIEPTRSLLHNTF